VTHTPDPHETCLQRVATAPDATTAVAWLKALRHEFRHYRDVSVRLEGLHVAVVAPRGILGAAVAVAEGHMREIRRGQA
jgi:hypothetical protein